MSVLDFLRLDIEIPNSNCTHRPTKEN